ncbi:DUF2007 domain-containing protein [Sphingomonas ginkgonis]|uniref:DUF2007 domain-containing protein n=1 Tax=Sphingomonas ginkgonis TaxID=2315330 RepID=A0A3R9YH27_9SPHN|nr:DUF2007 domain-containing protein [Sphingomonas ginkgonis]RST29811.1 DUF2007 domain-containing protein [Sphingomonas ginkgonis]
MALVELARFPSQIEADLARLALESAMIDVVLFDEGMAGFYGPAGLIPVRLMVLDEDLDLARSVLREGGLPGPG